MTDNRFRLKFTFWLDVNKQDEHELAEIIEHLKQERSFARTIRDGIRLIVSLRQRRIDILVALFPWLQEELINHYQLPVRDFEANPKLQDQLNRLEQLILQTGFSSQETTIASRGGPKPLYTSTVSPPVFDDDDDSLLTISRDTSTASADNFLKAAFALQG